MTGRTGLWMLLAWLAITLGWWGLAFYPTSDPTPEWLSAARYVCFGTAPGNAGPDAYGWMILILAPASLLAGIVAAWSSDLREALKSIPQHPSAVFVSIALVSMLFVEAKWAAKVIGSKDVQAVVDNGRLPPDFPLTSLPAYNFQLIDQSGERRSLNSLSGRTVILTFAYAHCQTVCPMLVQTAVEAFSHLDNQKVALALITLDPWRDTPSELPSLAKKWKIPTGAYLLSGPIEDVTRTLDEFGVPWQRNQKTGEITHPTLTYVVDPEGRIAFRFNSASATWLLEAVARLGARTQARYHEKSPRRIF